MASVGTALRVRSWSVRRKLVALMVATSLLPLAVAGLFYIRVSQRQLRDSAAELLAAHAEQLRGQLDAFHTGYLRAAQNLATMPAMRSAMLSTGTSAASKVELVREIFGVHLAGDHDLAAVAALDRTGRVLASTEPDLEHQQLAERPYVQIALRGESTISEMYVAEPELELQRRPVIAYVAPIHDGELLGAIVLWVHAEAVWDLMRGHNGLAGPGSFVIAFDADGIRIADTKPPELTPEPAPEPGPEPTPEQVFHPGGALAPDRLETLVAERRFGPGTRRLLEAIVPFPDAFARSRSRSPDFTLLTATFEPNHESSYGVTRRLTTAPWTVVYLLPDHIVEDEIAGITRHKLFLAGVIMVIAFVVGLGLTPVVLRPVASLASATARIAGGDLSARVPPGGSDEVGRLCASFNAMAERLETDAAALRRSRDELEERVAVRTGELVRASITEARAREALEASTARLELLSRTSHELAVASGDPQEVLALTARRLGEAVGEACAIRLISEDGGWLEAVGSFHHPDPTISARATELVRRVRSRIGEGIGGGVAASGEALLLPEVTLDEIEAASGQAFRPLAEMLCARSILTLPLRSRDRTIGVVSLVRSQREAPYTVDDQRFAQDIADRAGLAIDNAVLVATLERRVAARTVALETANQELEAFSYSVSHDLRAPLRTIDGFSDILMSDYGAQLDAPAQRYLRRIRLATQRMATLIDDLLNLARITRVQLQWNPIDVTRLARHVVAELTRRDPERATPVHLASNLAGHGDARLMTIVLENLLGNAWKFTAKQTDAEIWLGSEQRDGREVLFVRDTGAGFDMKYAEQLFLPFQRLHSADDFEGVGIGLATVHRIITHHHGRIWAEATVGGGATFFFFLGEPA